MMFSTCNLIIPTLTFSLTDDHRGKKLAHGVDSDMTIERRFDIAYYTLNEDGPASLRYERLAFDPMRKVQELRDEVALRCGWGKFELAAREGEDGVEFCLHDRDTINVVVGSHESERS